MDLWVLSHLELARRDEIDSVNNGRIFWVNFLAAQEGPDLHVVLDLFDNVGPQLAEHSESSQELNFFLQLFFLGDADDVVVVAAMECCKSCLFAAHDCSCAVFVL